MLHLVAVEPSFPLTLTLSLGEREQSPPGACLVHAGLAHALAGMAQRRRRILPRPGGEGWGEGKQTVAQPTVPSLRSAKNMECGNMPSTFATCAARHSSIPLGVSEGFLTLWTMNRSGHCRS